MTEDQPIAPETIDAEASTDEALDLPDVAFVVAPAGYQAIDTDDVQVPLPAEPEPRPAPDPIAPALEAVAALGDAIGRKLDALGTAFDREIRAEATREKVVDRLHAELQEYKQGLILGILRPVFVDLIQLHDDLGKMAEAGAGTNPGDEPGRLAELMRGFQQGVEDILYRQGVEPFALAGDAFDPRRQRALATVPTDDPDRNRTVAARLRKGFEAGDKVIRPEMVTVYSFK